MIVDLENTTTNAVNKKLDGLREEGGAFTMARVLTLVIAPDSETVLEESIEAANAASREHPCRVIVVLPVDREAADPKLDAQIRVGHDAGAGEVVVLKLTGPLAAQASSVVTPFLLPDTPVVAWWPDVAPRVPAQDPLGQLAIRRITDATYGADPLACIKSRLEGYTPGDTDLAWSRITYWRAMLTSALDQGPHEPIQSALVSGDRRNPPWTSWRVGWPAASTAPSSARSAISRSSWSGPARRSPSVDPRRASPRPWPAPPSRRRNFRWRAEKLAIVWPRTCAGWMPTQSISMPCAA